MVVSRADPTYFARSDSLAPHFRIDPDRCKPPTSFHTECLLNYTYRCTTRLGVVGCPANSAELRRFPRLEARRNASSETLSAQFSIRLAPTARHRRQRIEWSCTRLEKNKIGKKNFCRVLARSCHRGRNVASSNGSHFNYYETWLASSPLTCMLECHVPKNPTTLRLNHGK